MSREDVWRELISKQERPEWMLREWLHFVGWGKDEAEELLDDFYSYVRYVDVVSH